MKFGTDLTTGSIFKKYIFFVLPIIASSFLQQLYNAADTMVVGKFAGDTALAAVGSTSHLTNLILNLFIGLSVGINVVCSKYYGAENKGGLKRAIHTSILMGLIVGVPLAFVGWFGSAYFLGLMGTPVDVIDQAALYMRVFFLGVPAALTYNFGAAILRAAGDTKRPLYILSFAGIVNVVLNLVCVIVFKLGVVGVALGTIVSQAISAVAIIILLKKNDDEFKLKLSKLTIYKKELKNIISIGVPSGLSGVMFSLSNVIIQSSVNFFGKNAVAANAAASNVEVFGFLLLSAAEQAVISFVGQNMGAKKFDRVDASVKNSLIFAGVSTVSFAVVVLVFGGFLLGLFTDGHEVIKIGLMKLTILMSSYFLYVPGQVLGGALKGLGKAVSPTVINAVFVCLLRVVWVFTIFPLRRELSTVYFSYPVSWSVTSIATIIVYIRVRKKVFEEEKKRLRQKGII